MKIHDLPCALSAPTLLMTLAFVIVPCQTATAEPVTQVAAPGCLADLQTLCLDDYGYEVTVEWEDDAMVRRDAKAVFIFSDTGYLWFEDPRYPDVVVRLLDGCAVNSNHWVFSAGLSSRAYDLTVREVASGSTQIYSNSVGMFLNLADTAAFPCSPGPISNDSSIAFESLPQGPAPPIGLLVDDRFEVRINWRDFAGGTGNGIPVDLTGHANYFYFFAASSPDLFVKIIDNTENTGFFSVVASGLSNVAYDIEIIDTCNSGMTKVYSNPLGNQGTISDPMAFPATGSCIVFKDGFESGDLEAW